MALNWVSFGCRVFFCVYESKSSSERVRYLVLPSFEFAVECFLSDHEMDPVGIESFNELVGKMDIFHRIVFVIDMSGDGNGGHWNTFRVIGLFLFSWKKKEKKRKEKQRKKKRKQKNEKRLTGPVSSFSYFFFVVVLFLLCVDECFVVAPFARPFSLFFFYFLFSNFFFLLFSEFRLRKLQGVVGWVGGWWGCSKLMESSSFFFSSKTGTTCWNSTSATRCSPGRSHLVVAPVTGSWSIRQSAPK